jgi:hypothetical protein
LRRRLLVEAEIKRVFTCTLAFLSLLPFKLSPKTHDVCDLSTFERNIVKIPFSSLVCLVKVLIIQLVNELLKLKYLFS